MEKGEIKGYIAKRVAKEFHDGDVVNLGIGLPTMVPSFLPDDVRVILEAENGMVGAGPKPEVADPCISDAGGQPSSIAEGGAFIDSATSFGIIRGGHVDATVLGALQVDEKGNLANWIIPGKMVPGMGGAMDLVVGAKKVVVAMLHTQKGAHKILEEIIHPATAVNCVDMIVTDMGVMEVTENGLALRELAPGVSIEDIQAATGCPLVIDGPIKEMPVPAE